MRNEIYFSVCVLLTWNLARKLKFIAFEKIYFGSKVLPGRKIEIVDPSIFLITKQKNLESLLFNHFTSFLCK